jgi:hypothetical protein
MGLCCSTDNANNIKNTLNEIKSTINKYETILKKYGNVVDEINKKNSIVSNFEPFYSRIYAISVEKCPGYIHIDGILPGTHVNVDFVYNEEKIRDTNLQFLRETLINQKVFCKGLKMQDLYLIDKKILLSDFVENFSGCDIISSCQSSQKISSVKRHDMINSFNNFSFVGNGYAEHPLMETIS